VATIERDSFQFLYGTGQGWLLIIGAKENITNQKKQEKKEFSERKGLISCIFML
jgi:hypothetical protein